MPTLRDAAATRFTPERPVSPPDAPLLPLLNAAASRDVPTDLADRAIEASRSGNRRVLAVATIGAVAVVAVAAVVVAVLPEGGSDTSSDPAAANVERWGIPDEVPTARGLAESRRAADRERLDGLHRRRRPRRDRRRHR